MINTKRYCKRGHDTYKTGRHRVGRGCKLCHRLNNRKVMRKFRNTPFDAQRRNPLEIPNLRQVRKDLGLTQKQLSQISGVSEAHIGSIERGAFKASVRTRNLLIGAVAREARARKEKAA